MIDKVKLYGIALAAPLVLATAPAAANRVPRLSFMGGVGASAVVAVSLMVEKLTTKPP